MALREEKKRLLRKTISDLATRLFVERGYDAVRTAEIAAAAKVSVPTLFKYFPTKEALVFDEDSEREPLLVHTVTARAKGQSILDALLEMGVRELDAIHGAHRKQASAFLRMVEETPALKLYAERMWLRHAKTLAAALRKESRAKLGVAESEAIARFILDAFHRATGARQPKPTLRALFAVLRSGWRG